MAQTTVDIGARIEGVARYLGATYPTAGIERYEDSARSIVGFHFVGAPHADVEFEREWLTSLPSDVNGIAQELHLQHASAEINDTPQHQRVVFAGSGIRRESV
jgi:hypothetical protein